MNFQTLPRKRTDFQTQVSKLHSRYISHLEIDVSVFSYQIFNFTYSNSIPIKHLSDNLAFQVVCVRGEKVLDTLMQIMCLISCISH